jgi:hypothetical protein
VSNTLSILKYKFMKKLFTFLFISLLFLGCKSDDDSVEEQEQQLEIIGQWRLVDWYDDVPRDINGDGNASTDLYSQWNGCRKGNILVLKDDFTANLVYTGPNNNPKCPTGMETNDSFAIEPWYYDSNYEELVFMGSDYLDSYQIMELSVTTLVLKGSGFFTCCDPDISYFTDGYLKFQRE